MTLRSKLTKINHRLRIWFRPAAECVYRTLAHLRYGFRNWQKSKHPLPAKLIVSLTSYPPRFPTLHLTLKTLLSQSVAPDVVILWLYQGDWEKITPEIKSLVGTQFEIRTVTQDIKSYKKLVPALEAFPDAFIVTADDDVYYKGNWLRHLVSQYSYGKKEVLGHRAHLIKSGENQQILPYKDWVWDTEDNTTGTHIFLTGVGGILYPPNAFSPEVLDSEIFMSICPKADDIWFFFMAHKNGYLSRRVSGGFGGYTWGDTQESALFHANVIGGENDKVFQEMVSRFGNPL